MHLIGIKKISKTTGKKEETYCVTVPSSYIQIKGSKTGNRYKIGQSINFGLLYGRTAYGLAPALGVSIDEAQVFIDKYFSSLPKVQEFIQKAHNTVSTLKYSPTIIGRRRRFVDFNKIMPPKGKTVKEMNSYEMSEAKKERERRKSGMLREGTNSIIQGSVGDYMKIAMKNMHKKLKEIDAHLLIQIHDEVIVEAPEEKAEEVLKLVISEMETAIKLSGVPMVGDGKIADEWEK